MCVPYYVDGVEITRPNNECWCPLLGDSLQDSLYRQAARQEFASVILDALARATQEAVKPENAAKTQDGRIVEITLRMERW